MIELDVCVDRSGEVVVHHDTYLKATGQLLSVRACLYG
jgi:glycerophosphoryl diester phosphodiesterase